MTLTESFTFKYSDTGVVLNSSFSGLPFIDVLKVAGLDNSPYRETTREHEGTDGGFLDAEFEKGREISLEGIIYASPSSMDSLLDTLKLNFAPTATPLPFYFTGDGSTSERVVFAKSHGISYDWDRGKGLGEVSFRVGLFAEDPIIYGAESSIQISFGVQVFTGLTFNLAFNFGFGGTIGTGDGAYVVNDGNRDAPAVITITGPSNDPQIVNDTAGLTMQFDIDLPSSSDTLAIDLGNRTVTLNGTANRRGSLLDPNWFLLTPGANFLRYRAASGTGSFATVVFRSAWR
jgi:hypothetical protein